MTIAELHGKISGTGSNLSDRLEDLLTSDVFGSLLYAQAWDVFREWLGRAQNVLGQSPCQVFPEIADLKDVTMWFWPSGGKWEPDVAITLQTANSIACGLCVEAKYLSGKSNRATADAGSEADEADAIAGDQLAGQWCQLTDRKKAFPADCNWKSVDIRQRAIVFVTAHQVFPKDDLDSSLASLRAGPARGDAQERCFWLGWRHLHSVLEKRFADHLRRQCGCHGAERLLCDLYRLLDRKRLRFFGGFAERTSNLDMVALPTPCFWKGGLFGWLNGAPVLNFETPIFWSEGHG